MMAPLRSPAALLLAVTLSSAGCGTEYPDGVSEFGRYEGFGEPLYTEWVTESRYVTMRDGVDLAVDVTRPAVNGVPVDEPLPVVWTHSRYHRNPAALVRHFSGPDAEVPEIRSMVDAQPDLQRLVRHGYVVAAAGVRGSGASFGRYEGLFSAAETRDAYEITEWLGSQPWSDGNVGMYGGSYLGITQYMAASERPPSLKAIFPNVAALDMYDVLYPGGVYRDDMIEHWGTLTRDLDINVRAPRVDTDVEGVRLEDAIAEHADNWDVQVEYAAGRFRDYDTSELAWEQHGPSGVLDALKDAAIPAYHWNGWYDIFVTDATLHFANYEAPQKLGIGAWSHGGMPDSTLMAERVRLRTIEQHRWFDYWLKGIENGVMDGPAINYAVMQDPGEWTWASTDAWPPASEAVTYYFAAGPSGSVASANDGTLTPYGASNGEAHDEYTVDFTTTTGKATRWDNAVGAAPLMIYPDLTSNDAKALTYTTAVLPEDVTVTGHPIATLYVSSSTEDADIFVLLEEVDDTGFSRYVTEGVLRASHRRPRRPPWNNLGLPFQRSYVGDRELLTPGEIVELQMDLHPTSTVVNAGHRIRVTVTGADADNAERAPVRGTPTVRVYRGGEYASGITLPVVR